MTAQIAEKLHYDGEAHAMCDNPLWEYFRLAGIEPNFESDCTALWRGYVGTWEILDGRLYLVGLNGTLKNGSTATVATFFPNNPERVFAHWYSGELRLPRGKMLKYVHMGYASVYEEDVFIFIDKGVVTHTEVRTNGISSSPKAPEGYGIGAMTTFSRDSQSKDNAA
jgi:hypothetical protein